MRTRLAALLTVPVLLILQAGCQQPFPVDRHDLVEDRIAGVQVQRGDDALEAVSWLVVDGRPWADDAPLIRWFLLDPSTADAAVRAIEPFDVADAEGPRAVLPRPDADAVLGLVVDFPSGHTERALLDLPASAPAPPPPVDVSLATHPDWDLDPKVTTADVLALEARRDAIVEVADRLAPGAWGRLSLTFDGLDTDLVPDGVTTRWMATGGTFLELDDATTDWAAAEMTLDDLEIEDATALSDGFVTGLVLAIDGQGANAGLAFEIPVGDIGPALRIGARWLPVDTALPATVSWARGTLVADDTSPAGLRLTSPSALTPEDVDDALTALPCEGAPALFTPDLLFQARCTRDALDGLPVVVPVDGSLGTP